MYNDIVFKGTFDFEPTQRRITGDRMQKIILLFLCSLSCAQDNNATLQNNSYIDQAHRILSDRTESIATAIDDFIANRINTLLHQPKNQATHDPGKADTLFQSEKFLDETWKSFIKLSTNGQYNSKDSNDFSETISASLALNRSNQRFKLFINNLSSDQTNSLTEKADNTQSKTEIGLSIILSDYRQDFSLTPNANKIQATIKPVPPIGVIAPNHIICVMLSA